MTMVKGLYDQTLNLDHYEPKHVGMLLERIGRRMKHDLGRIDGALALRAEHEPLTPSYFRVLAMVPTQGARITDLAGPAAMTKQALGQLCDVLIERGYLASERSADDGRVKIVRRTPRGEQLKTELEDLYEQLHERWRTVVGPENWEQFHRTLIQLSMDWEEPGPRTG